MICKSRGYLSSGTNPRKASIARYTKGLVFMGTPHRGADAIKWAGIANKFAALFSKTTVVDENNRLVTALSKGSDLLEDLQENFSRWIDRFSIKTIIEDKEYGNLGKIVDKATATLGVTNEDVIHIPANHSDMCKFGSDTDIGYERTSDAIYQIVEDLVAEADQNKKSQETRTQSKEIDPTESLPIRSSVEARSAEIADTYRNPASEPEPTNDPSVDADDAPAELGESQEASEPQENVEANEVVLDGIQPSPAPFTMYADLVEKYTDRIKNPSDEYQAGLTRIKKFREQNSGADLGDEESEPPPTYKALMDGFNENTQLSQVRALYFAAFLGHEPIVDRLLQAGVNPNITPDFESDQVNLTPLAVALMMHEDDTVAILLENGADLTLWKYTGEETSTEPLEDQDPANGENEDENKGEEVEKSEGLEQAEDLDKKESGEEQVEETGEGQAEAEGEGEEEQEVEYDEDDTDDINFSTGALVTAAMYGTAISTSLLLEHCRTHDLQPIQLDYIGILHSTVTDGEAETLEILIRYGFPVDKGDEDGTTALHYACQRGYMDEAKILLRQGANPNIQDGGLRNALHYAVSSDSIDMLKLILGWDNPAVELEALDEDGDPALQYAVTDPAKAAMVDALLEKGASLKHKNAAGKTLTEQADAVEGNDAIQRIIAVSFPGALFVSNEVLTHQQGTKISRSWKKHQFGLNIFK